MSYRGPRLREISGEPRWIVTVRAREQRPLVYTIEARNKARAIRRARALVAQLAPPLPADYHVAAQPAKQVPMREVLL